MEKSTFDQRYNHVREVLVELRVAAGFSQRGLAAELGCARSLVSRIELGERRVDLLEFFWICEACDADPESTAADLMRRIGQGPT